MPFPAEPGPGPVCYGPVLLAVVIPVYNEEDALPAFHHQLCEAIDTLQARFTEPARAARVVDPIPAGTRYRAGTLSLDDAPLDDAGGLDAERTAPRDGAESRLRFVDLPLSSPRLAELAALESASKRLRRCSRWPPTLPRPLKPGTRPRSL